MYLFGILGKKPVSPIATSLQEAQQRITNDDVSLKEISLKNTNLSEPDVNTLCQLLRAHPQVRLNNLDLSYNFSLTDGCTAALSQVHMKKIDISGTQIHHAGVHQLLQHTILQHIIIRQNRLKDFDAIYFQENKCLLSIDLTSNALNADDVLAILHCKSLRALTLDNNPLSQTPAVFQRLAQSDVTHLSLAFNKLVDDCITELQQCRQKTLNLSNNDLSLTGAELFLEHAHITRLVLKPGNPALSKEDAEHVATSCTKKATPWYSRWKLRHCHSTTSERLNNYQMVL